MRQLSSLRLVPLGMMLACSLLIHPHVAFAAPTGESEGDIKSGPKATEDRRTPFERYQGAYLGAWLKCFMTQQKVFLIEVAKARGIALDPEFLKDADISPVIAAGLSEMKQEYNSILPLVKTAEGKKALLEHYIAAILHVKDTHARAKEDKVAYTERMNQEKRKTDELWVRFEITQP